MAKTNIYKIFDTVADETILLGMCKTDGLFIRQNLPYLAKINPNFRSDLLIYCVGYLSDSDGLVHPTDDGTPRLVNWDSYNSPESVATV